MNKNTPDFQPPPLHRGDGQGILENHVSVFWGGGGSLNAPWEWSWASLRSGSSFGFLRCSRIWKEMGEGIWVRASTRMIHTLGLRMPGAGVKLPPEQFFVTGFQAQGSSWRPDFWLSFLGVNSVEWRTNKGLREKDSWKLIHCTNPTLVTLAPRQAGNFSFILLTRKVTQKLGWELVSSHSLHHRVVVIFTI